MKPKLIRKRDGKQSYIPVVAGKTVAEFSPAEYKEYIQSLYQKEAEKPKVTLSFNKKGNPIIRVNRKPKFILVAEIAELAKEHKRESKEVLEWIQKRKIEVC
jgi:hypothetical protein